MDGKNKWIWLGIIFLICFFLFGILAWDEYFHQNGLSASFSDYCYFTIQTLIANSTLTELSKENVSVPFLLNFLRLIGPVFFVLGVFAFLVKISSVLTRKWRYFALYFFRRGTFRFRIVFIGVDADAIF